MAVTNVERGGSRTNPAFDALHAALEVYLPHIGVSDDIFYTYCGNCPQYMSGVVRMVAASMSMENSIVAENYPRIPFTVVEDVNDHTVYVSAEVVDGVLIHPYTMELPAFADTAYEYLNRTHSCMGNVANPVLEGGLPDRVNMGRYYSNSFRTSHRMRLSALLRCPNEPFRVLDIDTVLVDKRTRKVKLIIEESASASKATNMSKMLATNIGVPLARIITRDPINDVAEITVEATSGVRLNGSMTRFSSYRSFFEEWCVPNLS